MLTLACGGGAVPFAVVRQNGTDEVAQRFVVSFDRDYSSRVRGDVGPGRTVREGLVTNRVPEWARALWTSPDGTNHCKQIRIADSAPAGFPGRQTFPELIFKITAADEITVLFEMPAGKPDANGVRSGALMPPRQPLQISDCTDPK